jgi:hypothetical protein
MTSTLLPPVAVQEFFINGIPATGGKLFIYLAGTTTKATTYTDSTGGTTQTNPIVMNSRGEPENTFGASVGIWVNQDGGPLKFVFAPSTDTDPPTNPIWTVDNIPVVANTTVYLDILFEFLGGSPPTASQVLGIYVALRSERFFANFDGGSVGGVAAKGTVVTNPTATFTANVYRNAAELIGTISISTSGVFTFATTGGVSFDLTAGQFLKIVGPASPDATIADIGFSLPAYVL